MCWILVLVLMLVVVTVGGRGGETIKKSNEVGNHCETSTTAVLRPWVNTRLYCVWSAWGDSGVGCGWVGGAGEKLR